jgi:hypothetical protein
MSEPRDRKHIILTGVPRSGTTLACRLLSECPDVIALNEPMWPDQFPDPPGAIQEIRSTFGKFRDSLLASGHAVARTSSGKITDNAFSQSMSGRTRVVERGLVHFDKPLTPGFRLVMKHCAEFSLLLPELKEAYPVFAIVRNPLATLGSWASVQIPVSRGRVAKSARLRPGLYQALERIPLLIDKQLHILDWYFRQFQCLAPEHVLRYEDMIASGGAALEVISGQAFRDPELSNRNISRLYDADFLHMAGRALLERDGAYWNYYDRQEVQNLLETMEEQ